MRAMGVAVGLALVLAGLFAALGARADETLPPARFAIGQDLRNSGHVGRNDGQTRRHCFHEHVGDAVSITVAVDATRKNEDSRRPVEVEELALGDRSGETDSVAQP